MNNLTSWRALRRDFAALAVLCSTLIIGVAVATWPAAAQPLPPLTAGIQGSTGAPKAYVVLREDFAIAVFDTGNNRLLGTIPVPQPGPHSLVATPDGRKVYVSNDEVSTVSVIDTKIDQVVASLDVGTEPYGLTLTPSGRLLLASVRGAGQLVMVDTATDRVVGRIPVPEPFESVVSHDGRRAYVVSGPIGSPAIVIVDLASRTQLGTIRLDQMPVGLRMGADGRRLYFTVAGEHTVRALDVGDSKRHTWGPVADLPSAVLLLPDGHSMLIATQGRGSLEVLNLANNIVSATVKVGDRPDALAVGPGAHTVYITNERSDDVSVVDLATDTLITTIYVGHTPGDIVVQPQELPGGVPSYLQVQPQQH